MPWIFLTGGSYNVFSKIKFALISASSIPRAQAYTQDEYYFRLSPSSLFYLRGFTSQSCDSEVKIIGKLKTPYL